MKLCSSLTSCFIFIAALFAGDLYATKGKNKQVDYERVYNDNDDNGKNGKSEMRLRHYAKGRPSLVRGQDKTPKRMESKNTHLLE